MEESEIRVKKVGQDSPERTGHEGSEGVAGPHEIEGAPPLSEESKMQEEVSESAATEAETSEITLDSGGEAREGPVVMETSSTAADMSAPAAEISSRQLDVIDGGASQFARLVRGWETYIHHGTLNVQRGLQNLSLCGTEGLRLGAPQLGGGHIDDEEDLFAPIVLRHTHSSPLNYSTWFDDEDEPPPPARLDHMRRSSSTPSTSAFRQLSEGSAFGTNLRTIPQLSGPDDRSAFSLPMHRSSFASMSDPGAHYSAFNPIAFNVDTDDAEKTKIEVVDIRSPDLSMEKFEKAHKWQAATRAKNFFRGNVRALGRRKERTGGRFPARPASTSSSLRGDGGRFKSSVEEDEETISTHSTGQDTPAVKVEVSVEEDDDDKVEDSPLPMGTSVTRELDFDEATQKMATAAEKSSHQYETLDSDVDEEYEHYQRIEAIHDSPATIPSPQYHEFVDQNEPPTSAVRIQVSQSRRLSAETVRIRADSSFESPQPGMGRTASQDSGTESPGTAMSTLTNNTAGQTTVNSSSSSTSTSGRLTMLSVVSETDREVMETNRAGKDLRLQASKGDGDNTVHSSSTTSSATHGYLALASSPATIRDGASLRSDHFFKASRIPVSHSVSSNSGSSSSGTSSGASGEGSVAVAAAKPSAQRATFQRVDSQLTQTTINPFATSTSPVSNQGKEPAVFVSYLGRQTTVDADRTVARGKTRSSPPALAVMEEEGDGTEERQSPAQIVGYSQMVFEAAKPDSSQNLFRPVKKQRDPRFSSRPPLSPIKGLRTPTTPPPYGARPDSTSPSYQQLSPPTFVDHRIQSADLSKPYVLRSGPPRQGVLLVSPERGGASNPAVPDRQPYDEMGIRDSAISHSPPLGRSRTYQETSIEVLKEDVLTKDPANVVTPEKPASGDSAA